MEKHDLWTFHLSWLARKALYKHNRGTSDEAVAELIRLCTLLCVDRDWVDDIWPISPEVPEDALIELEKELMRIERTDREWWFSIKEYNNYGSRK